jgi:glycerol-3-phosphate dehydrogenase
MNREMMRQRLDERSEGWDVIVIGGGATGLGTALDAAARGYDTVLFERADFAKGTSSRSTKLIHGGVRYLQSGNVSLVLEALRERGLLLQNAPHLVHNLSFVVPVYDWWEGPFYGIGLKIYDRLAGNLGLGPSRRLSREETLDRIPTVEPEGLRGGIIYYDGQFDDARLAVSMARTAAGLDAVVLNYMGAVALLKVNGRTCGVAVRDAETDEVVEVPGRVVVNATGVFTDEIRRMDDPGTAPIITPSQGIHLVLHRNFLPGNSAIMVPHTDDGRVLFAVPWRNRVIVGTTDTAVNRISPEPRPLEEEVQFLLEHAKRYLIHDPSPGDVLSVFAGLRPLVAAVGDKDTASLSRDHTLVVSDSGLITITGGKWTTYRKMAEDTIDLAAQVGGLEGRSSITAGLHLHGWKLSEDRNEHWDAYGTDLPHLRKMLSEQDGWNTPLHLDLPYLAGEVVWAARHEMARNVEDVLARRTRALLLDAKASVEAAPLVARLLAAELGRAESWQQQQVAAYTQLADGYRLTR